MDLGEARYIFVHVFFDTTTCNKLCKLRHESSIQGVGDIVPRCCSLQLWLALFMHF